MFQMVVCDVKTRPDNDQVAFLVGSVPTLGSEEKVHECLMQENKENLREKGQKQTKWSHFPKESHVDHTIRLFLICIGS